MSIRANVDARALDQRVTIHRKVTSQDSSGDPVVTWSPVAPVWAKVDGAKAGEADLGGGIKSRLGYTVWLRADVVTRFSITQGDRVAWQGRFLNILDLPDQQLRGRLMALICDSGVNDGR